MTQLKEPIKTPAATYTNGKAAIAKDLVFGWCVLGVVGESDQAEWLPIETLELKDLLALERQVDYAPIFPREFLTWLAQRVNATKGLSEIHESERLRSAQLMLEGKTGAEIAEARLEEFLAPFNEPGDQPPTKH